ncbi:MAG: hypothetical protein LCI00_23555 [Chloroflexi bacterium]|nr:hypothetical protein [Chloroflexota bacterium]MCC6896032.1 hypothetical protein [Anaerolineae bacterium]
MGKIDFSKGGYKGGEDEEYFKWFTIPEMPYYWYFREILRASDKPSDNWQYQDGTKLSEEHQKELIALSLLNYAVHTGIAESLLFFDEILLEVNKEVTQNRIMNTRRYWKAAYSSLYTSYNSICNILYVILNCGSFFFKSKSGDVVTYGLNKIKDSKNAPPQIIDTLKRCNSYLKIRSQMDHYWTIPLDIQRNKFVMFSPFVKGDIVLNMSPSSSNGIDGREQLEKDIHGIAKELNSIYEQITTGNNYFDKYLGRKDWKIDYSNFQPHYGRPSLSTRIT